MQSKNNKLKKNNLSLRAVSIASVIGAISILYAGNPTSAISSDVDFSVTNSSPVLELTVPSDISLYLSPASGIAFDTVNLNIGIGTNNTTGYTLSMTPSSNVLTYISSSVGPSPTIEPMGTNGSATGYNEADFKNSISDNDTLNRWGYKLSTVNNFMPMSNNTTQLASTTGPTNATGSDVILNLAAKVDTTQPVGTYATTLNFTAVTNYVPKTNINQLKYMQEFAFLSAGDLASVKSSMAEDQQYTLKDSRDGKEYYISRLKDGNVWMTQNLDFDIKAGETYTSNDTDVPADWIPIRSTYPKEIKTWNYSNTSPESYDPGNVCWDGVLRNSYSGTLNNATIPCNENNINYRIGNYYNWTAAVAMNNSSSFTQQNTNINQSICPAGWRLPKNGAVSGSFFNLVYGLGLTVGTSGNIQNSPVFFIYGGDWHGSSNNVGFAGYYWSSMVYDSGASSNFYFSKSGTVAPSNNATRLDGSFVRCVAR